MSLSPLPENFWNGLLQDSQIVHPPDDPVVGDTLQPPLASEESQDWDTEDFSSLLDDLDIRIISELADGQGEAVFRVPPPERTTFRAEFREAYGGDSRWCSRVKSTIDFLLYLLRKHNYTRYDLYEQCVMVHKVGGEIQAHRKLKRELAVAISTMEDTCQDLIKRDQTNRDLVGLELDEKDLLSVLTRFRTERQVMESFRVAFAVFDDIDNRWKVLFDAVTKTDPKWNEDNRIVLTVEIVKAELTNIASFVADMVDTKFSSMYRSNDSQTQFWLAKWRVLYLLKRTYKDKQEPEADEDGDDESSASEDVSGSQPGQGSEELGMSQVDQGSGEPSMSQPNAGKRLRLVSDNDADTVVAGNWSVPTANGGGGNREELAGVSDLELTVGRAGAEEQQNEATVPPEVMDVVNQILELYRNGNATERLLIVGDLTNVLSARSVDKG